MVTTVLLATLFVCVVSLALAALLLLAERYLLDYGPCAVDINAGERRFEVRGGDMLLAGLNAGGVFIPSACGGRGTCSYCKVKIIEGGGPVGPTEEPLLTPEEIAADIRISCQVKVRGDIAVEIAPELLNVREYRGVVDRMVDLTHDVKQLFLRLLEPATIAFEPGQYVQLLAPAYPGSAESVYRAYSIASPPGDGTCIELIIRLVPGGLCTTWVFEHLRQGDEVTFTGPYGDFGLTGTDAAMVWIAGGSGMAPFWGIVRHMKAAGIARPTTYYFGAVARRDLFLVDELNSLADELPWLTFVPALSAPAEGDDWGGETGLITEVVDRGLGDAGVEGYLCGSGGMIGATAEVLRGKGVPAERIFHDEFT